MTIKAIATTMLALLLSNSTTSAVTQTIKQPITIAQSKTLSDTLIVPGERVGPMTRKTTKQNLIKLFGASRLVDKTISGAEGIGSFAATQVNLGRDRSFLVVWSDRTRTKPVDVRNIGSAWKTSEGIGVGTTFSQLRQKLGNFKLYGLAWDYGGTILLDSSRLSRYHGKLILQVDAAPDAYKKFPKEYQAVSGDSTFSATNPNWKPLGMRVSQIIVTLNPSQ
ncbi:hypothetical protein [Calothrix sp. PCC 7507]|uniref:hypothetical protein n=1 Tax=Calothrix sp. PCC 7507 TaxID=99598 RepID=UPI00029F4438|nr:hypothetical protein [Calothrix sp. PCC 7507]AFY35995.1 hypothetical protein Cal7507_5673 [Calothrix sp. PCC 7507]